MGYFDLANPGSTSCEVRQQFSRDHRSTRMQLDPLDHFTPEKFESAVYISDIQPKEHPHEHSPYLAVDSPHQMVRAPCSPSYDDVIIPYTLGESPDIHRIELAVAVTQEHVGLGRRLDSRNDRPAVPLVNRMMDDPYVRIGGGHPVGYFSRSVATAVVDHDNLVAVRDRWKFGAEPAHHALDIAFFIVRGQENAQTRKKDCLSSGPRPGSVNQFAITTGLVRCGRM